jgi:hypothetical protein
LLQWRSSSWSVEFDLSASASSIAPSSPIKLSVLSEITIGQVDLLLMLIYMRDVFNLSASDNSIAPSSPILLAASSENQMKHNKSYNQDGAK